MGEYFYTMNLTKKQYIHPHKLGHGLALLQPGESYGDTVTLLLCSRRDPNCPLLGSWEGDNIAVVGDYAHGHDGQEAHTDEGAWVDISLECRRQFSETFGLEYPKRWDEAE